MFLLYLIIEGGTITISEAFFGNRFCECIESSTKVIFVCCTRAKENFAVSFHNPDSQVVTKAEEWVGKDFVINIGDK